MQAKWRARTESRRRAATSPHPTAMSRYEDSRSIASNASKASNAIEASKASAALGATLPRQTAMSRCEDTYSSSKAVVVMLVKLVKLVVKPPDRCEMATFWTAIFRYEDT